MNITDKLQYIHSDLKISHFLLDQIKCTFEQRCTSANLIRNSSQHSTFNAIYSPVFTNSVAAITYQFPAESSFHFEASASMVFPSNAGRNKREAAAFGK